MSMSGGGGSGRAEETRDERTQAELAIKQWQRYQQAFAPLEDRLAGEVRTTPAEREQAAGQAVAASEQQFDQARHGLDDNLFAAGFNPASGGYQQRSASLGGDQALATGLNVANTQQTLADNEAYGLLGVSQLGRGDTASALSMAGNAAASAQSQAESDARIALNKSIANNQLVGGILGAGTAAATRGFGGPSKADYNGGMTGLDAEQWQPKQYGLSSGGSSGWGIGSYGS